jgi:hypothetical protein
MTTCCFCKRSREAFKTVKLSDEEKKFVLRHTGSIPPDEYTYCKACWKVATDRTQGASLVKGLLQVQYQRAGVRNAEAMATRVHDFLIKKAAPKPVS